ncbi:uncharacterized protein BP01DRAFT_123476 [Aspergillus saccharolyticus JOP 1030-1]|uniref:Uncharacterized protein n=1 Tax=Aspergillus saccharolyticus JOP 1030-1 TaxID=1450539 RepID=A0A318Z679_9EURO|nr:hypothetical protein BP01DRAFT_123476 [Aspergillus saccharolyticus JOP 1030-1]PYH42795.1 hypothetical protein BP01DRAFT_123476 [Aspergillus saccharolyticus JOP 1030-1]
MDFFSPTLKPSVLEATRSSSCSGMMAAVLVVLVALVGYLDNGSRKKVQENNCWMKICLTDCGLGRAERSVMTWGMKRFQLGTHPRKN